AHVIDGIPIRELARQAGCHASTVLRQVRRCESRRDDPLIDHALRRLGDKAAGQHLPGADSGASNMTDCQTRPATTRTARRGPSEDTINREGRRILRRLSEPGACLAVAEGLEKAVVVRETATGDTVRTCVVDREIAEAMALKNWITGRVDGRVARYRITGAGRTALRQLIEGAPPAGGTIHPDTQDTGAGAARYSAIESPLAVLARRRDKDGQPFLDAGLIAAGERLREDFELAEMGPDAGAGYEAAFDATPHHLPAHATGPEAARSRVQSALADLGPGLGDVVLRCCCYLDGMETIEKRMGWAARSGKIVLRIALQRLQSHYGAQGPLGPMIG
ncbi:hypothetical protein LCGC14_2492990, partial [marine sediment metagenome]